MSIILLIILLWDFLIFSWVFNNFKLVDIFFQNIHRYISDIFDISVKLKYWYIRDYRYFHHWLKVLPWGWSMLIYRSFSSAKLTPYSKAKFDLIHINTTYTQRCRGSLSTKMIHFQKSERPIFHQDNFHIQPYKVV